MDSDVQLTDKIINVWSPHHRSLLISQGSGHGNALPDPPWTHRERGGTLARQRAPDLWILGQVRETRATSDDWKDSSRLEGQRVRAGAEGARAQRLGRPGNRWRRHRDWVC